MVVVPRFQSSSVITRYLKDNENLKSEMERTIDMLSGKK